MLNLTLSSPTVAYHDFGNPLFLARSNSRRSIHGRNRNRHNTSSFIQFQEPSPSQGPLTHKLLARERRARWQHVAASSTLSLPIWPTSIRCTERMVAMTQRHAKSTQRIAEPHRKTRVFKTWCAVLTYLLIYNSSDPT